MAHTTYVLGFDGDCRLCSELALQIEQIAGGRLSVRSLRELQVQVWRERTLGVDAPWVPTLFAVKGEQVQAHTGSAMAVRLVRLLGPTKTWKLMQALSEIDGSIKAPHDPGRRKFLKAIGGMAVALSILSGSKVLSPSVAAAADKKVKIVEGQEMEPLVRAALKHRDVKVLRKYLQQRGFRMSKPYSRGFIREDGLTTLWLIFEAKGGGKDYSVIVWGHAPDGQERVAGALIHYLRDESPTEEISDILNSIQTTDLAVQGNQVVEVQSRGTGDVSISSSCSNGYTGCFISEMLDCCGIAGAACILSGPAILKCLLVVCSVCTGASSSRCYYCCNFGVCL